MRAFDIAVVGGGPAGSSTAIALARLGHAVLLLDRARFPRHKVCGDFLNPVSWPLLEELGVAEAVLNCAHAKITHFAVSSARGQAAAGALPSCELPHCGLGLQRYFLDDVLIQRAKAVGVQVREECSVTAMLRDRAGWVIQCRTGNGPETQHARLLVGADGRNSRVARQLKLDAAPARAASVGFQMRFNLPAGVEQSVQLHQFPGGYAGVVRLDRRTINVAFTVQRSALGALPSLATLCQQHLDGNPALRKLLLGSEPCGKLRSVWPVYFPARRRHGDGFVLVGDAAQVTEPLTGEGIYFALRSGQLAARSIAKGLKNPRSLGGELAQYESACRREFRKRAHLNACLRTVMAHPALLSPALLVLGWRKELLQALLRRVCGGASYGSAAAQELI
jgi:geranylgeranyl reductase family protein